ncbi:hypothetical protein G6F56_009711 [Rhizopus delemar]|nr:hypothetical protein G6F56_009711 [Rhizopus delemar]
MTKSVRISSPEEEESKLNLDTVPLVPPPSATHLSRKSSKEDLSFAIEMQQEDPFFYSQETRPESWSTKTIVDNPFEDQKEGTLPAAAAAAIEEEEDSDREFDWNDDPDHVKPKRRKTARERFQAAMNNPCCWHYLSPLLKRIIIAILGSCMFIIVAIVIYFTLPKPTEAEQQNPDFKNIRSNVQCWIRCSFHCVSLDKDI